MPYFSPFRPLGFAASTAAAILVWACASMFCSSHAFASAPADATAPAASINVMSTGSLFSKVVVLGDSISAGYQNGSLLDSQQVHGWASLVAQQAGFSLTLPLIAPPGVNPPLELLQAALPPVLTQSAGVPSGRENPNAQPTDLAVPGFTLYDLLTIAPTAQANPSQPYINLILGAPNSSAGTAVQQAVALQPSTIFLWIGGNDALPADDSGNASSMTPAYLFAIMFDDLIGTLATETQAHLVVANVPDVTEIPYMTPATEVLNDLSAYTHVPPWVFADMLGIAPGDLLNQQGLQDMQADVSLIETGQQAPLLPPGDIMTPAQIAQVQSTINAYNAVIAQDVAEVGGTLVDMHSLFDQIYSQGLTIDNFHASMLAFSGLFGVDGIHPTNTGYAVFANQFITTMNASMGTAIPLVDVDAVAVTDPLFGSNLPNSVLPWSFTGGWNTVTPDVSNAAAFASWPKVGYN